MILHIFVISSHCVPYLHSVNIVSSMPNGMPGAKRKRVDVSSQVCVSKLTTGEPGFVTMTGIDKSRDLPVWLEARVAVNDPAVREMRLSREHRSPAGLLVANAATMTDMIRGIADCIEKEQPASGFAFSPVGEEEVPPLVELVRAAAKYAAGMEKSAGQLYDFDAKFEEMVYNDAGQRTNTAVRAGETLREAERIGLRRPEERGDVYARLYAQDLGPNSNFIVDQFLKLMPQGTKNEVIDAVMTGGMEGGVKELTKQLKRLKVGVAVSPIVSTRLTESMPALWAEWEAASRLKLSGRIRKVECSGRPTNWTSINKTMWQVMLILSCLVYWTNFCLTDLARVAAAAQPGDAGHISAGGDDVHRDGRHRRELLRQDCGGAVRRPARAARCGSPAG